MRRKSLGSRNWLGLLLLWVCGPASAVWVGDFSVPRGCNRPVSAVERLDASRMILLGDFSVCGSAVANRLAGYNFSTRQFFTVGVGLGANADDRAGITPTVIESDGAGRVYMAGIDAGGRLLLARVGADNNLEWIVSSNGLTLSGEPADMDFAPDGSLYIATAQGVIRGVPGTLPSSSWTFSRLGSADLFPGPGQLFTLAYDLERSMVVVGGSFTAIDGTAASNLARWTGSSWQPLSTVLDGNGLDGPVYTLESVMNGNGGLASGLYVGGDFDAGVAGVLDLFNIARYNGSGYNGLGAALSARGLRGGIVRSIRVNAARNRISAAGGFHTAGASQIVNGVVQWDGGSWFGLDDVATGLGLDPGPVALADVDGRIVVGGNIDRSGVGHFNHLAHYQAGGWHALGTDSGKGLVGTGFLGMRAGLPATLISGNAAMVGEVTRIGLQNTRNVVFLEAATAEPLPVVPSMGSIPDFTISCTDPGDRLVHLFAEGTNPFAGGGVSGPHAILDLDSGSFITGSPHRANHCVVSAVTGMVYLATNGTGTAQIRSYDPVTGASTIIGDVTGEVLAMGFDPIQQILYIGGNLSNVSGVGAANAARFDVPGSTWESLGGASAGFGLNGEVSVIGVDPQRSDYVYFGGRFTTAGGLAQPALARWNGATEQWVAMPSFCASIDGACPSVLVELRRLLPTGAEQLVVGGDFGTVDGGRGLVAFDGSSWADRFDGGVFDNRGEHGEVTQLHMIGEQLYVAGFFAGTGLAEGSQAASGLARFQLGSVPGPDQVFANGFE